MTRARLTGEGIQAKLAVEARDDELNYAVRPMMSKRSYIGWTTTGHTGEDLFVYAFGLEKSLGVIENTEIALLCAEALGCDLERADRELFIQADEAFKALGATVTLGFMVVSSGEKDTKHPTELVVEKCNVTLVLPIGTDISRITKLVSRRSVAECTVVEYMDGISVYTAPLVSGPSGSALDLRVEKVYRAQEAIRLFRAAIR